MFTNSSKHIATLLSLVFGVVFLLIGVFGLFMNPILGLLEVNGLHNVIHFASGFFGLFGATSLKNARIYGYVMGAVYGLVTLLGLVLPNGSIFGLIHVNTADNILHLVLTIGLLAIGYLASEKTTTKAVM